MNEDERYEERSVFEWTFQLLTQAVGTDVFKRWDGARHLGRSLLAAFDTVTFGVSSNMQTISALGVAERQEWIREKVRALWVEPTFTDNAGSGVRGTTRLTNLLPFGQRYFAP